MSRASAHSGGCSSAGPAAGRTKMAVGKNKRISKGKKGGKKKASWALCQAAAGGRAWRGASSVPAACQCQQHARRWHQGPG